MQSEPLPISDSSVTKVGAVVLRMQHAQPLLLAIQPKPKLHTPDDLPPIGFVRGTRMFRDAQGQMQDADHDGRTPPPVGSVLELVRETLIREIEEEAGVAPAMLARAQVVDLGARVFASRKKTPYPIHWFLVTLAEEDALALEGVVLKDSLHTQWLSMAQLQVLVDAGRASAGYVEVARWALAQVGIGD